MAHINLSQAISQVLAEKYPSTEAPRKWRIFKGGHRGWCIQRGKVTFFYDTHADCIEHIDNLSRRRTDFPLAA